jgi:hypothetical protein
MFSGLQLKRENVLVAVAEEDAVVSEQGGGKSPEGAGEAGVYLDYG